MVVPSFQVLRTVKTEPQMQKAGESSLQFTVVSLQGKTTGVSIQMPKIKNVFLTAKTP
jgi:hypothetical protein